MSSGLTIRPYAPGDETAILQTFNLVFREVCGPDYVDRTLEQWRWAYLDNPAGHRISLAVADDGTVASQYAGMPMCYDTPWGEQRLIHCVDSMTHPAYRQGLKAKSLFVETCMPFWAHSRAIGDALFYGFPVDAAYRIGKRYLKYEMMRVIDYLIRDASAGPLAAPSDVTVEQVEAVPPDIGGLYDDVRFDKRCLLRRDYRYLQWRYVRNPAAADYELWTARRDGRLCGLMVLKPGSGLAPDACTIADWLVAERDEDAIDALLARAVARQREQGRERLMTV
ncbi:MAG: GNAT family N-acetyltransferase, partial [Planctomycetes bacterium]|nr:GNAT family N-acetyltransferase [Planctomycetota bacterium]